MRDIKGWRAKMEGVRENHRERGGRRVAEQRTEAVEQHRDRGKNKRPAHLPAILILEEPPPDSPETKPPLLLMELLLERWRVVASRMTQKRNSITPIVPAVCVAIGRGVAGAGGTKCRM